MSIDYYAIPSLDEDMVRAFIAGDSDALTVAIRTEHVATKLRFAIPKLEVVAKDFAAIAERTGITEAQARKRFTQVDLLWRGEESDGTECYIQLDVHKYGVTLSHGPGGERQTGALLRLIEALRAEGLYVWDPQHGSWLPDD